MNPYAGLVRAVGRTRSFAWVASRTLPPLDVHFAGRRRSLTSLGTGFPLCYLTTTGRRTRQARTVPLLYVADGERFVLVASNWGRRDHPAWALNLDACPDATVAVDGIERSVRARQASDAERQRCWAEAVRIWPGYEGYRRRAGREIRLYVLERSSERPRRARQDRRPPAGGGFAADPPRPHGGDVQVRRRPLVQRY